MKKYPKGILGDKESYREYYFGKIRIVGYLSKNDNDNTLPYFNRSFSDLNVMIGSCLCLVETSFESSLDL